jgi:hypothetical protein
MVAYSSLLGGASPVGLARPPSGFCAVTAARASQLQGWAVRAAADYKAALAKVVRDAAAKQVEEANKKRAEESGKTAAEEATKAKASATVDFAALSKRFVAECAANGKVTASAPPPPPRTSLPNSGPESAPNAFAHSLCSSLTQPLRSTRLSDYT